MTNVLAYEVTELDTIVKCLKLRPQLISVAALTMKMKKIDLKR
jgi:hypothetical protein